MAEVYTLCCALRSQEVLRRVESSRIHCELTALSTGRARRQLQGQHREVICDFAKKCAEIAWYFAISPRPVGICDWSVGERFNASFYQRHSMSNIESKRIAEVMWPALVNLTPPSLVVQKGIARTSD